MFADFLSLISRLIVQVANRDKFLKIIQYSIKLYLLKFTSSNGKEMVGIKNLASSLSLARLIYRLGDWIDPLESELSTCKLDNMYSIAYWEAIISLLNALVDDLLCISKCTKGVFPDFSENRINYLELLSSKLWLSGILMNMIIQRRKLWSKYNLDTVLAIAKLVCDAIFCLYDIYGWNTGREIPIISGIAAASIGLYRASLKLH